MLPDLLDQPIVEYEIEMAYALGQLAERERIAGAIAELDETTRAAGVDLYRDRVAERISLMEKRAAANKAASWRGFYPGGAVDFETGALAA